MKLLVAVDGSDAADRALSYAADLARATGGSTTAVHVVDPGVYDVGGDEPVSGLSDADRRLILEDVEKAETRGREILDDAVELAADRGHDVEAELLYGDPVEEITEYAADGGFETVVVGHRGRSERAELLLGSVAKALVERATVPVAVVR